MYFQSLNVARMHSFISTEFPTISYREMRLFSIRQLFRICDIVAETTHLRRMQYKLELFICPLDNVLRKYIVNLYHLCR